MQQVGVQVGVATAVLVLKMVLFQLFFVAFLSVSLFFQPTLSTKTPIHIDLPTTPTPEHRQVKPNFVLFYVDDMGWGDVGFNGHPTILTPHLDSLAAAGLKFTQFYTASPVCTPSRASLLTGRIPPRTGVTRNFDPPSIGGLPETEITFADVLKKVNYSTAIIGKWHLGHLPPFHPISRGFDFYYGIPFSNDMGCTNTPPYSVCNDTQFATPLYLNRNIIEQPVDLHTLQERYTQKAIEFLMNRTQDKVPFLLYIPYTHVHFPPATSPEFVNSSARGIFGDVVQELDSSVGRIVDALHQLGHAENTLVFFTADNGPWNDKGLLGGSQGPLIGAWSTQHSNCSKTGKFTTWEGGIREPAFAYWPGKIKPGITLEKGSTVDLFTTMITLAGATIPQDRVIDGQDLSPVLFDQPRPEIPVFFQYRDGDLFAVHQGPFKIHLKTQGACGDKVVVHNPPLLFNTEIDPGEAFNLRVSDYPDLINHFNNLITDHQSNLIRGKANYALDDTMKPCCRQPTCRC